MRLWKQVVAVLMLAAFLAVPASADIWEIQKPIELYGTLSQNDPLLVDLLGPDIASMACGPVAVTNSFVYLENAYPQIYNQSLTNGDPAGTAALLAQMMGTDPVNGTWGDALIYWKMRYIDERLPGSTYYSAQTNWGWNVTDEFGQPVAPPDWVEFTKPTWEWLYEELVACEDVEILLTYDSGGGHFVTLTSFHWDDVNNDGIIQMVEDAWIDFIDPMTGMVAYADIWDEGGSIETTYGGSSWISMAVKESPTPEPGTMLLLGLGGGLTLVIRRRRA